MDKNWLEIQNIVDSLNLNGSIIAPIGFTWLPSKYFSYAELSLAGDPDCFVLHKGMIGEYINYVNVLNLAKSLNITYANDVFIIFSKSNRSYEFKKNDAVVPHTIELKKNKNKSDSMFYAEAAIEIENIIDHDPCALSEYLWNLFLSGEFTICYEVAKRYEAISSHLLSVLEFYFRSRNFISVERISNQLIHSQPNIDLFLYKTFAENSLGYEFTCLSELSNCIEKFIAKGDTITLRIIELAAVCQKVWQMIKNNHTFISYVNTRYFKIKYIHEEFDYIKINNKIIQEFDAVITWIDSSDEDWLKQRSYNRKEYTMNEEYDGKNRLYQSGEIYLTIRLLHKNVIGIRTIFIVSPHDDVQFNWDLLSTEIQSKITFIRQDTILGDNIKKPCFNSDVIESQLYKIPNLSEKFIYLNDDYFVSQKIDIGELLLQDKFFVDRRFWKKTELEKSAGQGSRDANTIKVFYSKFDYVPSFMPSHQVYLCSKEAMIKTNEIFEEDFNHLLFPWQFRQDKSIRFLSLLFWMTEHMKIQSPLVLQESKQKFFLGLSEEQVGISLLESNLFLSINNLNSNNAIEFKKISDLLLNKIEDYNV